jgi:pyruvate dehydrogenase E2 component (dihydrolipoamide acetyltransferase)
MHIDILMPQIGMYMTSGVVARWLVDEGAEVKQGAAIVEIETDKATHTIEAAAGGILRRVAEEGAEVPCRGVVGYLVAPDEAL